MSLPCLHTVRQAYMLAGRCASKGRIGPRRDRAAAGQGGGCRRDHLRSARRPVRWTCSRGPSQNAPSPSTERWQLDLPSAERHLAVDTAAAPRGPLNLMAPLRATQHFPVRLHHRLQDLQTGRDAQAMECFPDTVDHAEDRQRHLDRDGSRAGGGGRTSSASHASPWVAVSFFDCIPCPTTGQGQEPPPASSQLKFNSVRDIPA